jgi:hypothetical protein
MPGPHETIIANAAKDALHPLGFRRKGRSRLWLQDRDWWLVVVEFQPSGWGKGSYLNVAAHWLWSDKGFLSFDVGERIGGFVEYASDAAFTSAARVLAENAAVEAQKLTTRFSSINATAAELIAEAALTPRLQGTWHQYHAGLAAGLAGQSVKAAALLSSITDDRVKPSADRLALLAHDAALFQQQAAGLIARQRQALGLSPIEVLTF